MFMYILSVEGYGQIHPARPCSHDFMENFGSGLCAEGAHAATVRLHRGSAGSDGAGDPLALDPGTSEKEPEGSLSDLRGPDAGCLYIYIYIYIYIYKYLLFLMFFFLMFLLAFIVFPNRPP